MIAIKTALVSLIASLGLIFPADLPEAETSSSVTIENSSFGQATAPEVEAETADADTADTDRNAAIIKTGESAIRRDLALKNEEAGHELATVKFTENNGKDLAVITLSPEFDQDSESDQQAIRDLIKTCELNGYQAAVLNDAQAKQN